MIDAPDNRIVYVKLGMFATLSCTFDPPLTEAEKQVGLLLQFKW